MICQTYNLDSMMSCSSLGMLEGHVLVSIEKVLKHFGISPLNSGSLCRIDSRSAGLLLKKRSNLIFGSPDKEPTSW